MKAVATITSKGQVTIPQRIRERLGLKEGDRVAFVVENGVTTLEPVRSEENPFAKYVGALGGFNSKDEVNAWLDDLRDDRRDD